MAYVVSYVVLCRDDPQEPDSQQRGPYVLATRSIFLDRRLAEYCASGIHASREPLVVPGRWTELRRDGDARFHDLATEAQRALERRRPAPEALALDDDSMFEALPEQQEAARP